MSGLHDCLRDGCVYVGGSMFCTWCGLTAEDVADTAPEVLQCLDDRSGATCSGPVEYRMPLSGTGKSFPRCEGHWGERLDRQAEIDRRYPDSPFAPAGFDPTYAGESWDGE